MAQHEDRDYTTESDQTYFDMIKPAILACMLATQSRTPGVDHLIMVIEEPTTSRVYASPRAAWLKLAREELRKSSIRTFRAVFERVSKPPSHPSAWWVVLYRRNGTFLACSILGVPLDKPSGSA